MRELYIDIETFSPVNLTKSGVYPYADHDDFELLLFGYSIDGGPVEVVDLANGHQLPDRVLAALVEPHVVKWAFNAAFERICLSTWLARHHPEFMTGRRFLDPAQWHCTMVWSAYLGLPMNLDQVATVLDLPVRKDSAGKKLIRQFCTPATPSVFNQGGMRNPPASDPDGWEQFISYNRRDVEVELAIHDRLAAFPVPKGEWDTYALDQRVNDTGIRLDRVLVDNAVACDRQHRAATLTRAQELTGLETPNSPIQLKEWLAVHGTPLLSLIKAEVAAALDTATGQVREVLQLHGELAKSSVKKYEAMQHVAGRDGRGCGFLQFYGAGRTGRFAGRLVQVQNLPATIYQTWPRPEASCGPKTLKRSSCSATTYPTPSRSSSAPLSSPPTGTGSWWSTSPRLRRGSSHALQARPPRFTPSETGRICTARPRAACSVSPSTSTEPTPSCVRKARSLCSPVAIKATSVP